MSELQAHHCMTLCRPCIPSLCPRLALCYGNSHKIVFRWQQCVFFIHASFRTVAYKATWHTAISSLCLVALPAKYVCVQQTHAAKFLLP